MTYISILLIHGTGHRAHGKFQISNLKFQILSLRLAPCALSLSAESFILIETLSPIILPNGIT